MRLVCALAATGVAAVACHASPSRPPAVATCTQVADHVRALLAPHDASSDHAGKVRDVIDHRCRDDRWATDVTSCMIGEADLDARHHCQDQLTAEQRTALNREIVEIDSPPPPPSDEPRDWPPECEEYETLVKEIQSCSGMPERQRVSIKQSFDEAAAKWTHQEGEARAVVALECGKLAEILSQTSDARCATP